MRIAFTTLGCKINQYDTDAMQRAAAAEGNAIVPFDSEADVYIINTCSVTAKSDYQCRQTIRAAVRRRSGATVIVTGCYAETRPAEISGIPGVAMVLGNQEKKNIVRYLPALPRTAAARAADQGDPAPSRTRTILKIQDGCDSRCSYCIVPLARGGSRSVPRHEIVRLFDESISSGCPEVVLSGIHIGRYGSDLDPRGTLTDLLRELLSKRKGTRIRLSSIEPKEISGDMIEMLGKGLCRHLHVPLQSGDDAILCSMNRDYTSGQYRELIESIAGAVPEAALGADVMVGFPGEGESEFQNTYRLIEELPLTHLHVFSYSPRPGTSASAMKGQVTDGIKKARSEALRALGLKKNMKFRSRFRDRTLRVVLEGGARAEDGGYSGLTDNYLRVRVSGAEKEHIGKEVPVLIKDVDRFEIIGEISTNHMKSLRLA